MKLLIKKSVVWVVGHIWMPNTQSAYQYELTSHDISNIAENGTITRDNVEQWINSHCGDFRTIEDFSASIELGEDTLDFPWENEDSECIYNDCRGED